MSSDISPVSFNQNWRARIESEIGAQLAFTRGWGSILDDPPPATVEDAIAAKKRELEELKARLGADRLVTTSRVYGRGESVEKFGVGRFGIKKNPELKPAT